MPGVKLFEKRTKNISLLRHSSEAFKFLMIAFMGEGWYSMTDSILIERSCYRFCLHVYLWLIVSKKEKKNNLWREKLRIILVKRCRAKVDENKIPSYLGIDMKNKSWSRSGFLQCLPFFLLLKCTKVEHIIFYKKLGDKFQIIYWRVNVTS